MCAWGVATAASLALQGIALAAPVYYHLVQYPGAGFGGFYGQLDAAKRSIDMEMYELSDPLAEQHLARAAGRGVTVRVLLDRDYSGAYVNASAYAYLKSHGVQVRWAPAHYIFHIKATTFDDSTTDVSTANLTSRYYATTRDAEVIDTDPAQVRAIESTFANDWRAAPGGIPRSQTVQAPGLIWSPNTGGGSAESAMLHEIATARKTIDVESEELSDAPVYQALAADARRGVQCRIVMMDSAEWDTGLQHAHPGRLPRSRPAPDLERALHPREIRTRRSRHARESLLIGSQNASWDSLHENRELGLLIHAANGGAGVIRAVTRTFQSDFLAASRWG